MAGHLVVLRVLLGHPSHLMLDLVFLRMAEVHWGLRRIIHRSQQELKLIIITCTYNNSNFNNIITISTSSSKLLNRYRWPRDLWNLPRLSP